MMSYNDKTKFEQSGINTNAFYGGNKGMKYTMKKTVLLLVVLLLTGFAGSAFSAESSAWMKVKASYQASFTYDLEDVMGFNMDRARIGAIGSIAKNFFFEVSFEGKYTQDGDGAELKKAYLKWQFLKDHSVTFGALQTAFTRPVSGTEINFINYDITSTPSPYQYGIMFEGRLGGSLGYSVTVCNGEGLGADNVGKGFLYMGRLEFLLNGVRDYTDGAPSTAKGLIFNASVAAALDNKSATVDSGVTYEYYSSHYYLFDIVIKTGDLALYGQANLNMFDKKEDGTYWGGSLGNAKQAMGGFAQISYNLRNVIGIDIEPIVKYEFWREVVYEGIYDVNYDIARIAVGLTYYVKDHHLKFNFEYRLTTFDNHDYFIKEPSDHFVGFRVTHKFASGKIGL